VGAIDTPAYCVSVEVEGRYAFVADQSEGLQILPAHCRPKLQAEPAPGSPAGREGPATRAHPNPFASETRFVVTVPEGARARLRILDAAGRLVRELALERAGTRERVSTVWDRRDDRGRRVASGVYFAEVRWEGGAHRERLVVLR
jgi:hypothetical protein